MDFRSIYQHGFARVAACTGQRGDRRPARQRRDGAAAARASARDEGVAVALFPELTLTGYSIEDLRAAGRRARRRRARARHAWSRAPPTCCRCSSSARRCATATASTTARSSSTAAASSASSPKSYPPTYREFYEGRQLASGVGERGEIRVGGADVPFGTDLLFAADDVPGLVVHAEVCEDMWIPVPPSAEAALAGATVLLNLSGSPITVGRAEDRKLLCRSASSRCLAAYVYAAAGQGESIDRPVVGRPDDDLRERRAARRDRALPGRRPARGGRRRPRPAAPGAAADGDVRRQPARAPDRTGAFRRVGFTLDPPAATSGCGAASSATRSSPPTPTRLDLDCYEAYNIQVAGLQQRLRAIGDPKVVIGVSGGLDSTHALIVAAQAMDRAGRPRSDILGFTLPGFATSEGTKANAHRLMGALGITADGARHHGRPRG